MGNVTTTENRSTQLVDTLMQVVNDNTTTCRSALTQEQIINLSATAPGAQIVIPTITGNQAARINTQCYQQNINSTDLENKILQAAQQEAIAITQTLALPSITDTLAVNDAVTKVAQEIINATRQDCSNLSRQSQVLNIQAAGQQSQIFVDSVNWNQTYDSILSCVQNSDSVSRAKNNLDQVINQYAKTEQKNTFGSLFLIIGIVIVVIIIIIAIVVVVAGPSIAGAATTAATKAIVPIP